MVAGLWGQTYRLGPRSIAKHNICKLLLALVSGGLAAAATGSALANQLWPGRGRVSLRFG